MRVTAIFLLALTAFSCKKNNEPALPREEVQGLLLEAVTQQPIADYPVLLSVFRRYISAERDAEFPNGRPVFETKQYQTRTDEKGRYAFQFAVHPNSGFSVIIQKEKYMLTEPASIGVPLHDDMQPVRNYLRLVYDTLLAERTGYVRFTIRHNTGIENEQLYLKTAFQTPFIRPDGPLRPFSDYNILLFGKQERVILDTVPAQSRSSLPVEWLHYLTDTIRYRKDVITVQPDAVTDYLIQY